MVLCASDRMLTAGDIEFEPPQTKIYPLTNSILVLVAGDAAAQHSISATANRQMAASGSLLVRDGAEIYANAFAEYRKRRNERAILAPLGLDLQAFIANQKSMLPEIAARITRDLTLDDLEIAGIVAGVDDHGAHVYVIRDPGQPICHDSIGFASIGIGSGHAESQFMFAGYQKRESLPNALMLLYRAKKRAEVAPGVGTDTDIYSVSRTGWVAAEEMWTDKLHEIYQVARQREDDSWTVASTAFNDFTVEVLLERERQQREAATATDGTQEGQGLDQEGVSGDPEEGEPQD